MSGEDQKSAEMLAAVAPVPEAEVPAQSESVEKVGEGEPMVKLGSDHDDYPEMYLSGDEETEAEPAKVELKNKVKVREQDRESAEVQELRSKVFLLEELWKTERALREMIEERNELKAQIEMMKAEGGGSSERTIKQHKDKKNRKRDNDNPNSEKSSPKKKQACSKCGKTHAGECMMWKNVCFNCKQEGHISLYCPKPNLRKCFSCGQTGHGFSKCPIKKKTGEGSGR